MQCMKWDTCQICFKKLKIKLLSPQKTILNYERSTNQYDNNQWLHKSFMECGLTCIFTVK